MDWLSSIAAQASQSGTERLASTASFAWDHSAHSRLLLPDHLVTALNAHTRQLQAGPRAASKAANVPALPPQLKQRLRIKPVPDDKQKLPLNPGHQYVGRHPFRAILSGESGTGKTTLLLHFLNEFYSVYFDEIYVWSPHFRIDSSWRNLKKPPTKVFEDFHEEDVDDILRRQDQAILKHGVLKSKKLLFLLDDMIMEREAMKSQRIARIYTIGRHKNTSVLVATQKLNRIDLTMRTNASLLCIFQASNGREYQCIIDEQRSQFVTADMFARIFNEATTRHPHGFLTINRQAEDPRHIYRFDLETIVPITLSLEEQKEVLSLAAEARQAREGSGEMSNQISVLELMQRGSRLAGGEKDASEHGGDSASHVQSSRRQRKRARAARQ